MNLNPGSDEALDRGCTCPVLDNGHGNPELGKTRGFWITQGCPLHSIAIELVRLEDELRKAGA